MVEFVLWRESKRGYVQNRSCENELYLHENGFSSFSLALKQRLGTTRNRSIQTNICGL